MKPENFLESLNCAVEGIIHAVTTQWHMRIHFAAAAAAIFFSLLLDLTVTDFAIVICLIAIVVVAELLNTAFEYVMDTINAGFDLTVKRVKDIAAGAVLFNALTALFAGSMIFSKYLFGDAKDRLRDDTAYLAVISMVVVSLCVIFIKAVVGRGRPLRGGMPSGHAALSVSALVSVISVTDSMWIIVPASVAAFIISFSRFLLGIHRKNEVIAGAFLGWVLTYLIIAVFGS